jgi:hypothetical protein
MMRTCWMFCCLVATLMNSLDGMITPRSQRRDTERLNGVDQQIAPLLFVLVARQRRAS